MDRITREIKWALAAYEAGQAAIDAAPTWQEIPSWADKLSSMGFARLQQIAPAATEYWSKLPDTDARTWDINGLRECMLALGYLQA